MFSKNKKTSVEKYQKHRKGKVSIFGISAEFDWFFINILTLVFLLVVSFFSIREIEYVSNFKPEADTEFKDLANDEKILRDLNDVFVKIQNN